MFALIAIVPLVLSDAVVASQRGSRTGAIAPIAQDTVTGRVVDSRGRPVEGAKVTLHQMIYGETAASPKVELLQEQNTGADGVFSLTALQGANPHRGTFIIARKEGLALGWAMREMQAAGVFAITLGEPKDLEGDVVDEKGLPIADAEVSVAFAIMGEAQERRLLAAPGFLNTKTDGKGHFLFANMPAKATFEFLVRKPGRVTLSTLAQVILRDSSLALNIAQIASEGSRCRFSPGQTGIRLTLPLEARVEGIVVEKATGRPVGGVKVTARADQPQDGYLLPELVTAAEDGTFRIGRLAAGSYTIQSTTTRGQMAEWVAEPVEISLKAGERRNAVKLQVTKGGIIEAVIRDTGGKPVEGVDVSVRHMQGGQHFSGSTDENGLARIRVPSGQYCVSGLYRAESAPPQREEQATIGEGETKRVEYVLNVPLRVTGTVHDETGNPVAGAKIMIAPMGGIGVATDANGEFALDWSPGLPGLQVSIFALVARDVARNLAAIVEVGERPGHLDLKLKPALVLTGTVLSQEGKPVAGASILVLLQVPDSGTPLGLIEQASSGENGTFEVKAMPPGRQYVVTAMADGYGAYNISISASNLNGNRQDIGQLKLPLADLSISGIVVDAHGNPVDGARVLAIGGGSPAGGNIRTDRDGKFVIKGISPGPIQLIAYTTGLPRMRGHMDVQGGASDVRIVVSE